MLAIRGAGDDQLVHALGGPIAHEFDREPVEQFRMRRQSALDAEVVFGLDDAPAKVLLPDAVHKDTRRKRIVCGDDPTREVEAIRITGVLEYWSAGVLEL